jgi:hypothetical protein
VQVRRCCAAVVLTLLGLAVACGSGRTSAGSAIVTVTGRIGPLHLDRSDRAAVIAFAGRPDAERRGQAPGGYAPYDVLGYGCGNRAAPNATPLVEGGPYCRTAFFINRRTGRLETVFTSAARYSEGRGVAAAVGIPMRTEENIYLSSATANLTIAFSGGTFQRPSLHVTGGHVYAFVLHSHRTDAGVFDCM